MVRDVTMISGGSRGIGRALVQAYLTTDWVATFARRPESLPPHQRLFAAPVDGQDVAAVQAFVADVIAQHGHIERLIVNAGICADASLVKMAPAAWQNVLTTNLTSTFSLIQPVFRQMQQQAGRKRLYLMTSSAAWQGVYGQTNYAASKAGLIGLMRALALEGAKHDILVNAIAPAALTDMTRPVIARVQAREGRLPAYWQVGSPEAFAATFRQLDRQLTTSGTVYTINGDQVGRLRAPVVEPYALRPDGGEK
ncbi:MAG: SDR family NAD(P)-dependent oxidoreductase [Lactobacillus sp.]|jgi:NAD(P)-dependent dehydrogenase (short-subunit alcohol dehydrogenase family)|nr:SDR family NAD(P)-dependent oxidoreductase [Lactobacillus sp.]